MALDLTMGGMDTPRYTLNHCPVELYIQRIVEYMMVRMEPTDRALRDAGDIYPAHGQPGRRHEDAACGYLPADDPRVAENGCSCGVAHSVAHSVSWPWFANATVTNGVAGDTPRQGE